MARGDGKAEDWNGPNHRGHEYRVTRSVARVTLGTEPAVGPGTTVGKRTEKAE